jgi:type I restriction enzyme M protein
VDTFEPEPEVDLKGVTTELQRIESEMGEVDEAIRGFCAELGLEAPV